MNKKITEKTILELLNKGLIEPGKYIVSKHFLAVLGECKADKDGNITDPLYCYLRENNYTSTGEGVAYNGKEEMNIYYINQKNV